MGSTEGVVENGRKVIVIMRPFRTRYGGVCLRNRRLYQCFFQCSDMFCVLKRIRGTFNLASLAFTHTLVYNIFLYHLIFFSPFTTVSTTKFVFVSLFLFAGRVLWYL
jgi:hypothetical protein